MNKEIDFKVILNLLQIGALIATVVWVFAVITVKQDQQGAAIERNQHNISIQQQRTAEIEIKQAVTTEQYRQIMEKLEQVDRKLTR